MNSNNESNTGHSGGNSIRAKLQQIEKARVELMQELERKVASLPEYLGLGSLPEVIELIRAKNETGSVEAFAGAALPQRLEMNSTGFGRRRGQRGKAIGEHTREDIKNALLRGEEGILIARRVGVSASTVSGVRKALESAKQLKN